MPPLQKKIAAINDFSGYGRCSLTVALPVISRLKVQCCPVPTSIFSNHTAFPHYYFDDYTGRMTEYISHWKQLDLHFDGILTGFLGSREQIAIVQDFIAHFKGKDTIVIIDPIMGDHGKTYATYTPDMCNAMRELCASADILTPNLTEACILAEVPYAPHTMSTEDFFDIAGQIANRINAKAKIVITGIHLGTHIGNVIYTPDSAPVLFRQKKTGTERCGTGDIFSSIIAADAVKGADFTASVKHASGFVKKCIEATEQYTVAPAEGVCFEEVLHALKPLRNI